MTKRRRRRLGGFKSLRRARTPIEASLIRQSSRILSRLHATIAISLHPAREPRPVPRALGHRPRDVHDVIRPSIHSSTGIHTHATSPTPPAPDDPAHEFHAHRATSSRGFAPPPPRARASPRVPSAPSSPTRGARPSSRTSSPSRTARVVVAIALATRRVASVLFSSSLSSSLATASPRARASSSASCARVRARATSRVTSTSRVCIYLHAIDRSDTARTVSSTVRAGCAVTSRRRARAVPCGVTCVRRRTV